jgi:hypothetical protein
MATYAVIENNKVINKIIADTIEIAEEVTGKTCVEYNETKTVDIDFSYDGTNFIPPKPFPSWTLDSNFRWQPPTEQPAIEGKNHVWDEATTSWVETP